MSRLTNYVIDSYIAKKFSYDTIKNMSDDDFKAFDEIVQKLGRYEDLEEHCRFIGLPCKVGDTVYLIDFEEEEWEEATVDEIVITDERIEINSNYEIGTPSDCEYIAYSEAEARMMLEMWKLAELKGGAE